MRKARAKKRPLLPDPRYNDTLVTRFVNTLMNDGKKTVAYKIFYDAMDRVEFDAEDFIDVGDRVVVPIVLRARGRTTGIEVEQRLVGIWDVRDGKAIGTEVFATMDEAMAAARGD